MRGTAVSNVLGSSAAADVAVAPRHAGRYLQPGASFNVAHAGKHWMSPLLKARSVGMDGELIKIAASRYDMMGHYSRPADVEPA